MSVFHTKMNALQTLLHSSPLTELLIPSLQQMPYADGAEQLKGVWTDPATMHLVKYAMRGVLRVCEGRAWELAEEGTDEVCLESVGGMFVIHRPFEELGVLTPQVVVQALVSAAAFCAWPGVLCAHNGVGEDAVCDASDAVGSAYAQMVARIRVYGLCDRVPAFLDSVYRFQLVYREYVDHWTKARIIRITQELRRLCYTGGSSAVPAPASGKDAFRVFQARHASLSAERLALEGELDNLMQDPAAKALLLARTQTDRHPLLFRLAKDMALQPECRALHALLLRPDATHPVVYDGRALDEARFFDTLGPHFFTEMTWELGCRKQTSRLAAFLVFLEMEFAHLVGDQELLVLATLIDADRWIGLLASGGEVLGHLADALRQVVSTVLCNGYLFVNAVGAMAIFDERWQDGMERVRVAEADLTRLEQRTHRPVSEAKLRSKRDGLYLARAGFLSELACCLCMLLGPLRRDMEYRRSLRLRRGLTAGVVASIQWELRARLTRKVASLWDLEVYMSDFLKMRSVCKPFTPASIRDGVIARGMAYNLFVRKALEFDTFYGRKNGDPSKHMDVYWIEAPALWELWEHRLSSLVLAVGCYITARREGGAPERLEALRNGVRAGLEPTSLPFRVGLVFETRRALADEANPLRRAIMYGMLARIKFIKLAEIPVTSDDVCRVLDEIGGGAMDAAIEEVDNMAVFHVRLYAEWYEDAVRRLSRTTLCENASVLDPMEISLGAGDWVSLERLSRRTMAEWRESRMTKAAERKRAGVEGSGVVVVVDDDGGMGGSVHMGQGNGKRPRAGAIVID